MITREVQQRSSGVQSAGVWLGLATFGGAALFAAESTKQPENTSQEIIDNAVARGVPGLQAYVRKGQTRWTGVSGVASVEKSSAMTGSQRIRLASITKLMTYATVMDLVREGRLHLSDRAVTLLPVGTLNGIPFGNEITVAQLLDHTSGLHNFNGEDSRDFFRDLFSDPQRGRRLWTSPSFSLTRKSRSIDRPGDPAKSGRIRAPATSSSR